MKTHHMATAEEQSHLARYQMLIVGHRSLLRLLYFEGCLLLGVVPGAFGLLLRKIFWARLFGSCGAGAVFDANVGLRHPGRIHIGRKAVISEGSILDARSTKSDRVLMLGDDVTLSNNVILSCKNGSIAIGDRCGFGAQTIVQSTNDNPVTIGSDVAIGPQCYIIGGGSYHTDRLDIPIWRQGIKDDGGVTIQDDVWLGARVTVLGGVTMGKGSIAAAGSVVTSSVPPGAICAGVPARVVKMRDGADDGVAAEV